MFFTCPGRDLRRSLTPGGSSVGGWRQASSPRSASPWESGLVITVTAERRSRAAEALSDAGPGSGCGAFPPSSIVIMSLVPL